MKGKKDDNKNCVLLKENPERYCVFPIEHKDIWDFYKDAVACFWTAEEIDFASDVTDWDTKLNSNERFFIKNILAFFASADGIVNENLVLNFYNEVQLSEARAFYAFQIAIESVHSEVYSLMIDTLIKDNKEKDHLFNAIETIPSIKKKADWALKWITKGSFAERLVAFSVVEGVFFSGAFCSIYWLKSQGKMPALGMSNEFISRDEGMHMEFACLLYSKLDNKLPKETIEEIVKEAVEYEKEFITESLPVSLLGMNCDLMKSYIEFVADRLMVLLGYNNIYNSKNPFGFMELISLDKKVNFFERRSTTYARANIKSTEEERKFNLEEDF
jgi:ribonucleoside-diphosphate reductase beta chain